MNIKALRISVLSIVTGFSLALALLPQLAVAGSGDGSLVGRVTSSDKRALEG